MSDKNGGTSRSGQTTERKLPPEWPHSSFGNVRTKGSGHPGTKSSEKPYQDKGSLNGLRTAGPSTASVPDQNSRPNVWAGSSRPFKKFFHLEATMTREREREREREKLQAAALHR